MITMSDKPTAAAALALVGGILSILINVASLFIVFLPLPTSMLGILTYVEIFFITISILGLIGGILMFSTDPDKIKMGAILSLISGIFNILTVIGGILLIIGGALGLSWSPKEEIPSPVVQPIIQPSPISQVPNIQPVDTSTSTATKTAVFSRTSVTGMGVSQTTVGGGSTEMLMARFIDSQGRIIPITSVDKVYGRKDFSFLPSNIRKFISSKHFRLFFRGGKWYILDLNSKNGTYVNGQDIRGRGAVPLSDGDKINLSGIVELTFESK